MTRAIRLALTLVIVLLAAGPARAAASKWDAYLWYLDGLIRHRSGDPERAVERFHSVLAHDSDAAAVNRDLAMADWQIGDSSGAYAAAERLKATDGDSLSSELFLGSFYLMAGQNASAGEAWKRVLERDPSNENALRFLAIYHGSEGDLQTSLDYWDRLIAGQDDNAEAFFRRGQVLDRLGRGNEAISSMRRALDLRPESAEIMVALGQLYESKNQPADAARIYENFISRVPDNIGALLYLGGLYFKLKDYPAAENVFQRALDASPNDPTARFWLGVVAEQRQDYPRAIELLESIPGYRENPLVLSRLSFDYSALGRSDRAAVVLRALVKREPRNYTAHFLLGMAYLDLRKYSRSVGSLQVAAELAPGSADVQFHLGVALAQWGKAARADQAFRRAFEIDPRHARALNYLGYMMVERGRGLDEAEGLIRRAIAVEPENGSYADSLGWLFFKRGEYAAAAAELERATRLVEDTVVWEHLGDVRGRLGQAVRSWQAYWRARALPRANAGLGAKIRAAEKSMDARALPALYLAQVQSSAADIAVLRGDIFMYGQSAAFNLRAAGSFAGRRGGAWRVSVIGQPGGLVFTVCGSTSGVVRVFPAALAGDIPPGMHALADSLGRALNGSFVAAFSTATAQVAVRRGRYEYTQNKARMVIDRERGLIRSCSLGLDAALSCSEYFFADGKMMPARADVAVPGMRASVRLTLRNIRLNRPMDDAVLSDPALPIP